MRVTTVPVCLMAIALTACDSGAQQAGGTPDDGTSPVNTVRPVAPAAEEKGAPASPTTDDIAQVQAAVRALFAPYLAAGGNPPSSMDPRADYSAGLNAAIRAWRAATVPEGDALSGVDWLCACQDWDPATAEITVNTPELLPDGRYIVPVDFAAMADTPATVFDLVMMRERGRWLLDDIIYAGGDEPSLMDELIAATPALRARRPENPPSPRPTQPR